MTFRNIIAAVIAVALVVPTTFATSVSAEPTPAVAVDRLDEAAEPHPSSAVTVNRLDEVRAYLASWEFIVSRKELQAVDPDPVPEVIQLATAKRTSPLVKERAIKCMSLYRSAQTKAAFVNLLDQRPDKNFSLIVMAFMEAFGEDAVDDVAPFLTHERPAVRAVVAKAFGIFGGQPGYDMLVEHNVVEKNLEVLTAMERWIR